MNDSECTILIPAHNEASVIARTLKSIFSGNNKEEFKVIVVCNACTDETASVVAEFCDVALIETDKASKVNALNLGDEKVDDGDIRVYMDADIVMTSSGIVTMVTTLNDENLLAVSPNVKMEYSESSWLVRAYYDIWLQLPYVKKGFMGGGVYALSAEGRKRFDRFPDVISDDGFIRSLFDASEVKRVNNVYSLVYAPKTFLGLIKIKTRSRFGQYDLLAKFPEMQREDKKSYRCALLPLLKNPLNVPKAIVYLMVNLVCRARAKWQYRNNRKYVWETDASSRSN